MKLYQGVTLGAKSFPLDADGKPIKGIPRHPILEDKLEKEEKVFVIAPESTYGVGRTETDTIKLRRLYDEGYRIATEQTDALRAYLNK